jgi:hypothetical protein
MRIHYHKDSFWGRLRERLDSFRQGNSMALSKSAGGFRPVSPAFLLLDFVPVVPVSVRTGRLIAEP